MQIAAVLSKKCSSEVCNKDAPCDCCFDQASDIIQELGMSRESWTNPSACTGQPGLFRRYVTKIIVDE